MFRSHQKDAEEFFKRAPNVGFVCVRVAAFRGETFWMASDCDSQESVCDKLQKQLKGKV